MKILKQWPAPEPKKLSKHEMCQPYLDGRIYQFNVDDCHTLFGMPIVATRWSSETTDEKLAEHTEYLRSRAIIDLESMLRNACRLTHGPYQSKCRIINNEVLFQFTGLQICRLKVCKETAVEDGKGYCATHYGMKKKAGKIQ